ncbi:MAG: D-tyrosyl-tRNA(Tyr) deacylase [Ruminococcus sp.]|nr:D-tyrosyl-tRNA(Tyr) deacylase [Ruminococcus sp.]
MKAVIQRVTHAECVIDGETVGAVKLGFMILFGAGEGDTEADCDKLAEKISKLRIFADENGKTNLSIDSVGGDMLIISQFTLFADCRKGNRPSFLKAGDPAHASRLYDYFCDACRSRINGKVERGEFGADMKISLTNDGPFTIVMECENGEIK